MSYARSNLIGPAGSGSVGYYDQTQDQKGQNFTKGTTVDKWCQRTNTTSALRQKLMDQLNEMADPTKEPCWKVDMCKEDYALEKLRDQYKKLADARYQRMSEAGANTCELPKCLQDFDDDAEIKYLDAKRKTLESLSFNFLHRICDNVTQGCAPNGLKPMPDTLLECSGIYKPNALFFMDRDLAAIGRQCAGSQRNGNTPAARGHCADFFPVGTVARGSDALYVNVCTYSYECNEAKPVVKWVRANLLENAAYATRKEIMNRITARKKQILSYGKEILKLQSKMYLLQPTVKGMGRVQSDPNLCLPVANVDQVVQLGLQRFKANMISKQNEAELKEMKQSLDQSSMLVCNKPFSFNNKPPKKAQALAGGRRRKSKRRSKRRKSRR